MGVTKDETGEPHRPIGRMAFGEPKGERTRLVRHEETVRLEVVCGCGELTTLDALEPWAVCGRCGVELEPDAGELLPMGVA